MQRRKLVGCSDSQERAQAVIEKVDGRGKEGFVGSETLQLVSRLWVHVETCQVSIGLHVQTCQVSIGLHVQTCQVSIGLHVQTSRGPLEIFLGSKNIPARGDLEKILKNYSPFARLPPGEIPRS